MTLRKIRVFAILLTALALVPGGAHLLALPNKIGLPAEQYLVTQGVYQGWALLGIVLFAALAADALLVLHSRRLPRAFVFAAVGLACVAATLIIFFAWTYPANQATENWTRIPVDWAALRARWEYSHAVNAVLLFLGLGVVTMSALEGERRKA